MKKVWTAFIMFSLFFLFSFSYAVDEIHLDIFDELGLSPITQSSFSDITYQNNFVILSEDLERYPYYFIEKFSSGDIRVYFFQDIPCLFENLDYAGQYEFYPCDLDTMDSIVCFEYYKSSSYSYILSYTGRTNKRLRSASVCYTNIPDCDTRSFNIVKLVNGELVLTDNVLIHPLSSKIQIIDDIYSGLIQLPSMENPLSDEEIKSILEIFLESMNSYGMPKDYERFVLTYNIGKDSYSGYVYSKYSDISLKYMEQNIETNFFEYFLDGVGPFYSFFMYSDNRPPDYKFNYFNKPSIIEFNSNEDNTAFIFNKIYDLDDKIYALSDSNDNSDLLYLSTENEPIIYTTNKIYSLIFTGNILGVDEFEEDENTSLDYKEIKDESGNVLDDTISTIQPDVETNVNLLSFIELLFGFIFSVVSFIVRFFAFLINFIYVPASTNILPEGFVQGIDWIQSFAFGEILLWDIFSIVFDVLLGIYILRLINETSG